MNIFRYLLLCGLFIIGCVSAVESEFLLFNPLKETEISEKALSRLERIKKLPSTVGYNLFKLNDDSLSKHSITVNPRLNDTLKVNGFVTGIKGLPLNTWITISPDGMKTFSWKNNDLGQSISLVITGKKLVDLFILGMQYIQLNQSVMMN